MGRKRDVSAGQSGPPNPAAVETETAALEPEAKVAGYRDRIIELRRVPASQLRGNPRNWRTHPDGQKAALSGMLARVGIANAVVARLLPDGGLEIVDGHLRAETLEDREIPVLVLDVDEAEALALLATMDPLAGMAGLDAVKFSALLEGFVREDGAAGLDALFGKLEGLGVSVPAAAAIPDLPKPDIGGEKVIRCPRCGLDLNGAST